MNVPTTKGLLAIVIAGAIGIAGGAMYKHTKDTTEVGVPLPPDTTEVLVTSPPDVKVTVLQPKVVEVIDPFVEEVIQVKEDTEILIDTIAE